MNQGFVRAMRLAAPILFVIAILAAIGSAASVVFLLRQLSIDSTPQHLGIVAQVAAVTVGALQDFALPLFGAALIWRADHWLRTREGGTK